MTKRPVPTRVLVFAPLLVLVVLSGCGSGMPDDLLYLNPVWRQHQPLYYQDPETGVYSRPWVRVHATKDYYDMAAILDDYPEVVPVHRELQEAGQIEEFSYPNDAVAHLERSVEVYREHFGREPVGLWPAEGAVAQEIVKMVADAGYEWMATGDPVLARSLGTDGFTRDATDTVVEADTLYRPCIVQSSRSEPVAIVFRDLCLSDLVGFEYSGTPGEAAAADFMRRLGAIRARLEEQTGGEGGPHLVSVILDGENAWEHYPNDGKEFLNAIYRKLSESETTPRPAPRTCSTRCTTGSIPSRSTSRLRPDRCSPPPSPTERSSSTSRTRGRCTPRPSWMRPETSSSVSTRARTSN